MRLEHQEEEQPHGPLSPLLHQEAINGAHAWLARFSPLLDDLDTLDVEECRRRVGAVPELRDAGARALEALEREATPADGVLLETVRGALEELGPVESDLRRRLGLLAPDDPEAEVDLERIRARLAEAAARREVESLVGSQAGIAPRLEIQTSPGNLGAAGSAALVGLGMIAFTSVHAMILVGAFFALFGPLALLLLAFYALFWVGAFGTLRSGFRQAWREQIEVTGSELTIRRNLFSWSRESRHTLNPDVPAYVTEAKLQRGQSPRDVALQDVEGRDLLLATGRPLPEQERLVERLNEHLKKLRT